MKHYVKPECRHGCRFIAITPALSLCPHASFGEASYLKGAVDEARALLERAGGYETVLAGIIKQEEARKDAARKEREERQQNPRASEQVRYG